MSRLFAYCRCSTTDQHPENQVMEIRSAGFDVQDRRIVMEHISGSVPAKCRPEFLKLLDRLEAGDSLLVSRLDRLGRDAVDIQSTVTLLATMGVRVHCLQLGGVDLTSPTGKLTMQVIAAVAEMELSLLKERTAAGLQRAKSQGKKLGRPSALSSAQEAEVLERLSAGETVSAVAKALDTSRQTIMRVRDRELVLP